jgi:hypothetical protein
MLVPWQVTAADYVECEMLRVHSHQNGIWLSSNEEERFDRCRTARADMDWRPAVTGAVDANRPQRLASIFLRFPIKDER